MSLDEPPPPPPPEGARRSLEALRALVEATTATGQEFFDSLVVNLARSLQVRHALVGMKDATAQRALTLAVAWDGALGGNFVYELVGTPCEGVLGRGELAYYPANVAALFPQDTALARLGIQAYMGAPLVAPDGTVLGLLVVLHDAPLDESLEPKAVLRIFAARAASELERLRSEERRQESEDTLRYALGAARMATFDWEPDRELSRWSDGAAALFGLSPGTFGGRIEDLVRCVHPDDREGFSTCANDALAGRLTEIDCKYRVVYPDRTERWIHHRGRVLRRSDGTVRVSGVVADVTEQRTLEEGLLHAQKMEALGRLAGGVAHDFNNLLTVILSFSEMAEAHLHSDAAALELVVPIREAGERAAALTRQLLAFARRQKAEPRVLRPDRIVKELARLLARLLGEAIRLDVRLGATEGAVRMDPGQLEQVLVNLAVNARDAMPRGGALAVETDLVALGEDAARARLLPPGDYLRIRVRDTGTGMDAETLARAFEPFFTTKAPDRGTGLGLATCHGIVAQAGGAIVLESEPGSGTCAVILLPRLTAAAEEDDTPAPTPGPRGSATLLFVEDEDVVRKIAVRALGALGYHVLAARDGTEALDALARHGRPIDLLVTDMVLPAMDGREVARRVTDVQPGVRVLYASGSCDRMPGGPLDPGADFLQKPYTPAELAARIGEALR